MVCNERQSLPQNLEEIDTHILIIFHIPIRLSDASAACLVMRQALHISL